MLKRLILRPLDLLDSLAVQTMLIVLLGIGVMHVASLWTYQRALVEEAEFANEARLADRLLAIKRTVLRADPADREAVAHDMSGGAIEAHWSSTEFAVEGTVESEPWRSLGEHLVKLAPELGEDGLVIGASSKAPRPSSRRDLDATSRPELGECQPALLDAAPAEHPWHAPVDNARGRRRAGDRAPSRAVADAASHHLREGR